MQHDSSIRHPTVLLHFKIDFRIKCSSLFFSYFLIAPDAQCERMYSNRTRKIKSMKNIELVTRNADVRQLNANLQQRAHNFAWEEWKFSSGDSDFFFTYWSRLIESMITKMISFFLSHGFSVCVCVSWENAKLHDKHAWSQTKPDATLQPDARKCLIVQNICSNTITDNNRLYFELKLKHTDKKVLWTITYSVYASFYHKSSDSIKSFSGKNDTKTESDFSVFFRFFFPWK